MNTALVYLLVRSMRGKIVRAIRLLKEPKYLIGIIVFVAWIGFWVIGPILLDDDDGVRVETVNFERIYAALGDGVLVAQLLTALVIGVLISLWWLVPWSRVALSLTEAEIHMLTPLPISRRHLIQYATLKSQPGILFGCLMMTIFLGAGGPVGRIMWFAQFWVVLTLWDLHAKGRSLWLEKQKELPRQRAWRNRILLTGGILVYWIAVAWVVAGLIGELAAIPSDPSIAGPDDFERATVFLASALSSYAEAVAQTPLYWMLLPFVLLTAPLFIGAPGVSPAMQVIGLAMPIVLLLGHNEWVVRSQAKFEEAALAHARREANKTKPGARYWRTSERSRRRTSFALAPSGAPELGILWKNSMMVTRFSYRTLAMFGLVLCTIVFLLPLPFYPRFQGLPFIPMSIGFITMLISPITGPLSYRNDMRTDLLRVEMIRPWPLEGWKLFAAEVAGPTLFACYSMFVGAGIVIATSLYVTFSRYVLDRVVLEDMRIGPIGADGVSTLGVPDALLLPLAVLSALPPLMAIACLTSAIQNLVVMMFPGWVHLGNDKQQGAAAFGQNMIMFFGLGLAILLSVLPAALLIGVIVAVQVYLLSMPLVAWELPIFGVIAATPVFTAAFFVVRAGGKMWRELDPSRELLEGGA